MRPRLTQLSLLFVTLTLVMGCTPEEELQPVTFDGHRAFEEVRALVQYSPRDAGTPSGKAAADHILTRLQSFGITSELDSFKDTTPEGEKQMHNVVGRILGTNGRWIILGSHFDTMQGIDNFQGANDSGSSTGILLELARMFSTNETLKQQLKASGYSLIFAFFDGEEGIAHYQSGDGLHGSRHMARQLHQSGTYKQIDYFILLDMVGDRDLSFTIPQNSDPHLAKEILAAAHATGHRKRFSLSNMSIIDDHVPFMEIGIPAIDLIDFKFGSEPGLNDYWHTPEDNLEHISAKSLAITGTITQQLLKQLLGKAPQ